MNNSNKSEFLVIVLLAVGTFLSYALVVNNNFVIYDDWGYIVNNSALGSRFLFDGVAWAFKHHEFSYWHPLTWLSLMLDYQLFGLNPAGYHLVNLGIHIANASLLFHFFNKVTGRFWPSALVAALFALHPINVESVAWAVERKSVLSTLFCFLTLLFYLRYARTRSIAAYAVTLGTFFLGLMAKPSVVALPLLMLCLDYWPLQRLPGSLFTGQDTAGVSKNRSWSFLFWEKVPYVIMAVAVVKIVSRYQSNYSLGAAFRQASLTEKVANAIVSPTAYIRKLIWPDNLAVFYPPRFNYPFWEIALSCLLLVTISLLVLYQFRKRPWLLFGWAWFIVSLAPFLGLKRNGEWPEMADRFAYIPFIGLFLIFAWFLDEIMALYRNYRPLFIAGIAFVLVGFGVRTFFQVQVWTDSITLFENAAREVAPNPLVYDNLAVAYYEARQYDKARYYFSLGDELLPNRVNLTFGEGYKHYSKGDFQKAINSFNLVLFRDPDNLDALMYLGKAYEKQNDIPQAISCYTRYLARSYAIGARETEYAKEMSLNLEKLKQSISGRLLKN